MKATCLEVEGNVPRLARLTVRAHDFGEERFLAELLFAIEFGGRVFVETRGRAHFFEIAGERDED